MKLVGAILLIVLLSQSAIASLFDCKGRVYSRLDRGDLVFRRVVISDVQLFKDEMTVTTVNGQFTIQPKKKSDDWTYHSYVDKSDAMYIQSFRRLDFGYTDLRADRESFHKYKENSVVGFNLVCRM